MTGGVKVVGVEPGLLHQECLVGQLGGSIEAPLLEEHCTTLSRSYMIRSVIGELAEELIVGEERATTAGCCHRTQHCGPIRIVADG